MKIQYLLPILCLGVVISGSANGVLGKIRSKPLGAYDFFVSFFNALIYTFFYSLVMTYRYKTGKIPSSQFEYLFHRRDHDSRGRRYHFNRASINDEADLARTLIEAEAQNGTRSVSASQNPLQEDSSNMYGSGIMGWRQWFVVRLWGKIKREWKCLGGWKYLLITGICDGLGNILGFISQPWVPGALYSILSQGTTIFVAIVSIIVLRRRYIFLQVVSFLVVISGALIALLPQLLKPSINNSYVVAGCDTTSLSGLFGSPCGCKSENGLKGQCMLAFFAFVTVLSTIPTATSFVFKELMFLEYAAFMQRKDQKDVYIIDEQRNSDFPNSPVVNATYHDIGNGPQATSIIDTPPSATTLRDTPPSPTSSSTVSATREIDGRCGDTADATSIQLLDVFVVGAFGSLFQLFFIPFALPLNKALGQTHGTPLAQYVKDGFKCISGITPQSCVIYASNCTDWGCCDHALTSYVAYAIANVSFNTFLLTVIRCGSALLAFLCMKAVLPTSLLLFVAFKWPLLNRVDIGASPYIWISLVVILIGIIFFRYATQLKYRISQQYFNGKEPTCLYPLSKIPSYLRNYT